MMHLGVTGGSKQDDDTDTSKQYRRLTADVTVGPEVGMINVLDVDEPEGFAEELFDLWQICARPIGVMEPNMRSMEESVLVSHSTTDATASSSPSDAPRSPNSDTVSLKPLTPGAITSSTTPSRRILHALERVFTLNPARDGGSLEELEAWLTRLLVGVHISMIVFPLFTLIAYWSRYTHPVVVALAVGVAIVNGCVEVVLLRRGHRLGGRVLLPLSVVIGIVVAGLAVVGAGSPGRVHGLDGFLPYLMMIPGLCGVGLGFSFKGVAMSAVAGLTWAVMPIGRGPRLWNDEGGFLLWFVAGALVAATLRLFAARLDEAFSERITAERRAEKAERDHWIHENLIGLCERLADNALAPGDARRARRLAARCRLGIFDDTRVSLNVAEELADIVAKAGELGLHLKLVDLLMGDPPARVTEPFAMLIESLIGNTARHTDTSWAELALRTNPDSLEATLSDRGSGFNPRTARWSTHTQRLIDDARALGMHARVSSNADGTRWEFEWKA
jgi:hypothetical protein